MMQVLIIDANYSGAGERWDYSASDIALEIAAPLLERWDIDSIFCVSGMVGCESHVGFACTLADRLCLKNELNAIGFENGDTSGAIALQAAYAHIAAGLSRAVLVIGIAKVSDEFEQDRYALLDRLLDAEAERSLGLSYMAQAGLLADYYCSTNKLSSSFLAEITARNQKNAVVGGETYLKTALTGHELRRDIRAAAPLVRSDFAPLLDGGYAVVVANAEYANERGAEGIEFLSIASARDITVLWDRPDPLRFGAVNAACETALRKVGATLSDVVVMEVDNPCSIIEAVAMDSLLHGAGLTGNGTKSPWASEAVNVSVNPKGGVIGRGNVLGASGIAQARELYLQFTAADRETTTSRAIRRQLGMALSIGGFGNQAVVTLFGKGMR